MYRTIISFLMLAATFLSCKVQHQTKFTTERLIPGMTKEAVVTMYGKPYKESSSFDKNGVYIEEWHYKEEIYVHGWYEINNILYFENGTFKYLKQGKESPSYRDMPSIIRN